MAFAKKFTRLITVGGQTYRWHLRDNSLDFEARHIAVQHCGVPGQLLLIDPFSVEIRPKAIRAAIVFALGHGWKPQAPGSPVYLGRQGTDFTVLSAQQPYMLNGLASV